MEENERQFASYEYYDQHKEAADWLMENASRIRQLAGENYDDWRAYAERYANAQVYDAIQESVAENADGVVGGIASSVYSIAPSLLRGIGSIDIALQKFERLLSGSDVPVDYKTMWQHPGMTADTIRGTVSGNIAEGTEDWVGGDTAYGNLYALAYEMGMDLADEVVATKGLGKIGIPGGKYMYELSRGHKGYMDSIEQGRSEAMAPLDSVWAMAGDDLFTTSGYAIVEGMTPDERSEKFWKMVVDIAEKLLVE